MKHSDKTRSGTAIFTDKSSFKEVVDESFDRLWDKKVEISIRHIRELEAQLSVLEVELDMIIKKTSRGRL
jgi:hypothetical protein